MTTRARRALQALTAVTCVVIAASAITGGNLATTALSQVLDYPPPRPLRSIPGVTNRVQAVSVPGYDGPVLVCQRPGVNCRPLDGEALVGIGAYLDTTRGAAQLETPRADGSAGGTVVYAGLFRLRQARRAGAVLDADLQGRLPTGCPPARGASTRTAKRPGKRLPPRRLWSNGTGRFRATGRYGSAAVRGTKWLIEERCTGTVVRVTRGTVAVDDLVRHRTTLVTAPHTVVIRPRR